MTNRYVADIAHAHRHAILSADNHAADVRLIANQAKTADIIKLPALRIESAASIGVVDPEL